MDAGKVEAKRRSWGFGHDFGAKGRENAAASDKCLAVFMNSGLLRRQ
jgi:hypothetical protein